MFCPPSQDHFQRTLLRDAVKFECLVSQNLKIKLFVTTYIVRGLKITNTNIFSMFCLRSKIESLQSPEAL